MIDFSKLNYEIIDAHIHPAVSIEGSDFTSFKFSTPPEKLFSTLKRAGITQAAGSVVRRFTDKPQWEELHQLNLAALELHRQYPDFYIPGIHIHPDYIQESLAEIETMNKCGVKLVGELVAYMMGYKSYSIPALNDVWSLIQELDMTVSIHGFPEDVDNLLKNFPDLKLILAHPTSNNAEYNERLELVAKYPNAALDISGSGPNTWNMLRHGIRKAGINKLIFGTDFPLRNPGMYVAGVCFEELTDAERQAIFADNFKRLLK